jgi:hypothetical protein
MTRMLILSVVAAFSLAPAVRAEDDPKAILQKAIKAHGGEEFLTKNKAARSQNKGKIQVPGVGEAEFTQNVSYMLPDKLRDELELSIAGQQIKIVTIANGDTISITAAGRDVEITDNIKAAMKDARDMLAMARLVALTKDKSYELSLFGETKVEGKPAVGVRISAKGKKDVTLFFDAKTNLLVKIEHRTVDGTSGNEVGEERIITEYKNNKDGIPLPKKVVVKRDGKDFLEAETVETTLLEKIDENEFKK